MDKAKILVIDDEQIVLDSVEKILSYEGYQVILCGSATEGLQKALNTTVDCVLSDIRMPEMGGMKILREIKRAKPELPVILITGYSTVESAVQAMKLGASDYLEKPFTPDTITETVAKALSQSETVIEKDNTLIHKDEVLKVLERAAGDKEFAAELFFNGPQALESYTLTSHEKLAILTGDIAWIESFTGPLSADRKKWLEQKLSAEIW